MTGKWMSKIDWKKNHSTLDPTSFWYQHFEKNEKASIENK